MRRETLEELVGKSYSIRQIAIETEKSPTSVRHWLAKYGIETERTRGLRQSALARNNNLEEVELECRNHGKVTFRADKKGTYRCVRCRTEAVIRRRRKLKERLVEEAGGCCVICGYDRCIGALSFHHLNPEDKKFGLAEGGLIRSLERSREETRKCALLCSNCHAEVEAGITKLSI